MLTWPQMLCYLEQAEAEVPWVAPLGPHVSEKVCACVGTMPRSLLGRAPTVSAWSWVRVERSRILTVGIGLGKAWGFHAREEKRE